MIALRMLVLIALCIPAGMAADQDKRALAEELMAVMHPEKMMDQVMNQLSGTVRQQLQTMNVPEDTKPLVDQMMQDEMTYLRDKLDWTKLKPQFVDMYADVFTEGELREIVAFYKSPGGQAFLDKTPVLTQRSITMMQALMTDLPAHLEEMNARLRKQIEEKREQEKSKTPGQ